MFLAVHKWRMNPDGSPEQKMFSEKAWSHLLSVTDGSGGVHPKGGFIIAPPENLTQTPPSLKGTEETTPPRKKRKYTRRKKSTVDIE